MWCYYQFYNYRCIEPYLLCAIYKYLRSCIISPSLTTLRWVPVKPHLLLLPPSQLTHGTATLLWEGRRKRAMGYNCILTPQSGISPKVSSLQGGRGLTHWLMVPPTSLTLHLRYSFIVPSMATAVKRFQIWTSVTKQLMTIHLLALLGTRLSGREAG